MRANGSPKSVPSSSSSNLQCRSVKYEGTAQHSEQRISKAIAQVFSKGGKAGRRHTAGQDQRDGPASPCEWVRTKNPPDREGGGSSVHLHRHGVGVAGSEGPIPSDVISRPSGSLGAGQYKTKHVVLCGATL